MHRLPKLALAGLMLPSLAAAQSAFLTKDTLVIGEGRLPVRGTSLAWSPDGKYVLVLGPGGLTVVKVSEMSTRALPGVVSFKVSPDSRGLLVETTGGALEIRPLENPTSGTVVDISPRLGTATWSADSQQVLFAKGKDLLAYSLRQNKATKVSTGREYACLSWSEDGRLIAGADLEGVVTMLRPNGRGLTAIGSSPATSLEWSPNGRYLLCRTSAGYEVISPTVGAEPVYCDKSVTPTWTGGQRLVVAHEGQVIKRYWSFADRDEPLGKLPPDCVAWAMRPRTEIGNDSLAPDPIDAAARPSTGQLRAEGTIDSIEPMDGKLVLSMESWLDARGRVVHLPEPELLNVKLGAGATQSDGKASRRLLPSDLVDGDRVILLLKGDRPDPGAETEMRDAWIEGAAVIAGKPAQPSARATSLPASFATAPHLNNPVIRSDGATTEEIVVPIVFPVAGARARYSNDFLNPRSEGRQHHGTDVFEMKLTKLVAAFDGRVTVSRGRPGGLSGNSIKVIGDNGWTAVYYHVNNDSPETDDGVGGDAWAFAPGIESGVRVKAGQFLGYLGDSGNAETTDPHCHFELHDNVSRAIVNPYHSLKAATIVAAPAEVTSPILPEPVSLRPVERNVSQWRPLVEKHAKASGLEPDLVEAVIQVESSGDPKCFTPNRLGGAMGLMQLLQEDCFKYGVRDPYDPDENIRGGVAHLHEYILMFDGDIEKGLIAYNAGPSRVKSGSWRGIAEARNYVPKVRRYYRLPSSGKLGDAPPSKPTKPADPGSRVDTPILLLPPVVEPTPRRVRQELEKMMDVLRASKPGLQLDLKLSKVAEAAARNAVEGVSAEGVESLARLALSRTGLGRPKVTLLSSSSGQGFAERWAQVKAKFGSRVGLGVAWQGERPYWCVVSVE